jgi:hypothetical protein
LTWATRPVGLLTQEITMAEKQFQVLLLQHDWVNTEVFTVSAKDAKSAQAEAEKLIKSKDLEGREYKLEVRDSGDVSAATPAPTEEPTEPVER